MIDVDVCGLSCPEPVLIVMDIMEESAEETLKVICDAAYTRYNIAKLATEYKYRCAITQNGRQYELILEPGK